MPVLIEDRSENSLTWGVSLTSSNPLPQDFVECWSKAEAAALLQFVESLPEGSRLVRETLPKYRVFFVLQEHKLAEYRPIIERSEKLSAGVVACWSIATEHVDFDDFQRKGSVAVDGYFIHDDSRAGGDCVVFQLP